MGCAQQCLTAVTTDGVQPASAKALPGGHAAGMGGPCQTCYVQAALSLPMAC